MPGQRARELAQNNLPSGGFPDWTPSVQSCYHSPKMSGHEEANRPAELPCGFTASDRLSEPEEVPRWYPSKI